MSGKPVKEDTKHEKLKKWISDRISDGTYRTGDRLVSENELCSMFGISRHTVRHALDILESDGIVSRRRGSGTFILKKPDSSKRVAKNISVSMSYLDEYIFPSILKGIDSVLTKLDYNITLGITYNRVENEERFLLNCIENRVDGVILEATKSATPSPNLYLYRELTRMGIPYVFINCYYSSLDCSYVIMNDRHGGSLAASCLLDAGHKNIAGIFKGDDMQGRERFAGFAGVLANAGCSDAEAHVLWYATEDFDGLRAGAFDDRILRLLSDCTGVICYNDQIAMMLIQILERHNIKVPDDISIVSFDNSNLSVLGKVKLTTLNHASEQFGEKAAESIFRLIESHETKINYVFEPELIIRDSVRNLNG